MLKLKLFIFFMFLPVIVIGQDQDWSVFKSTHFIVFYKQAAGEFLDQLSRKAEGYYDEITEDLGFNRFNFWTWDNRAKLYLFDTAEEFKAANNLNWSIGLVTVGNKTIQSYVTAPGLLDNVLSHEMAHIIFREMVGFNNPAVRLWLDEGVAAFQERRSKYQTAKGYLIERIRTNTFMSLSQLNSFNPAFVIDTQLIRLFYFESYSIVEYLINEFGKDKFVLFCQYLRDYQDLTRALRVTYSFDSLLEFESAWKAYILK